MNAATSANDRKWIFSCGERGRELGLQLRDGDRLRRGVAIERRIAAESQAVGAHALNERERRWRILVVLDLECPLLRPGGRRLAAAGNTQSLQDPLDRRRFDGHRPDGVAQFR